MGSCVVKRHWVETIERKKAIISNQLSKISWKVTQADGVILCAPVTPLKGYMRGGAWIHFYMVAHIAAPPSGRSCTERYHFSSHTVLVFKTRREREKNRTSPSHNSVQQLYTRAHASIRFRPGRNHIDQTATAGSAKICGLCIGTIISPLRIMVHRWHIIILLHHWVARKYVDCTKNNYGHPGRAAVS